jgi:hypothetical protein
MIPLPSPHSEIVRQMVLPATLIIAVIAGLFYGFAILLMWWGLKSFVATLIALLLTYAAIGFAFFVGIRRRRGR